MSLPLTRHAPSLNLFLLGILAISGCGPSQPEYEVGRDTVQSFGNGRFQVCEGAPKNYLLIDNKIGGVQGTFESVVSWRQSGHFAYIISKNSPRFRLLDIPAERLSAYKALSQLTSAHRKVFQGMFHSAKQKFRSR